MIGHEPAPASSHARQAAPGTICGVANVYPHLVQALLSRDAGAETKARIATFIEITFMQPFLPAFKCMVSDRTGDAAGAMCGRR